MDINYQYTKLRRDFGRQPLFCEMGPEMCDSIATNPLEHKNYILRNPVHEATQHTPVYGECHVNTVRAEYSTTGVNHAEGGWPKDVNVTDPELTQRYRRKIEKEDNYIHCVMTTAPGMDHYVLQNNAIDMYGIYYGELAAAPGPQRGGCRTVNVYRDGESPARPVASLCWQPDGGQRFAATYADVPPGRVGRAPLTCFVWDVERALEPVAKVAPPSALLDLQYNAREAAQLAGALADGRVALWDARRGARPVALCAPHVAHRDLVRCVLFINAKSGQEFFSGSPDGVCKWWDARNLSDVTDEMVLDVVKYSFEEPSMATANGVSALEFEPTIPTRFMAGTDNGLVLGGNRKGKTALDKLPVKFEAHLGPVWTVERNPGFLKNFVTVGDWTARVWSEDCRESAILWSAPHRHKVTAAAWSPTRLSLLALAQWDGSLALWDLLRRQHEPVLAVHVCAEPLLRLRMHEGGHLLACGSQKGNIYMVEMSQVLAESGKNDKTLLTMMFERESKRERILEARMREIRLKQRQAEEGGGSAAPSGTDLRAASPDRDLADAAADYLQLVRRELAAM